MTLATDSRDSLRQKAQKPIVGPSGAQVKHRTANFETILRELLRGRLEITGETSEKGSRIRIRAERILPILVVALILVAFAAA